MGLTIFYTNKNTNEEEFFKINTVKSYSNPLSLKISQHPSEKAAIIDNFIKEIEQLDVTVAVSFEETYETSSGSFVMNRDSLIERLEKIASEGYSLFLKIEDYKRTNTYFNFMLKEIKPNERSIKNGSGSIIRLKFIEKTVTSSKDVIIPKDILKNLTKDKRDNKNIKTKEQAEGFVDKVIDEVKKDEQLYNETLKEDSEGNSVYSHLDAGTLTKEYVMSSSMSDPKKRQLIEIIVKKASINLEPVKVRGYTGDIL